MVSVATERVGMLIRAARLSRGLTLIDLAELARVSPAAISKIERGKQSALTVELADRILAAMDLRLHVETVPLWADFDTEIDAASRQSLAERISTWPFGFSRLVSRLDGIPYLLDGLTAAAVQGVPVQVEELQIAVPRDEKVLDQLTYVFTDIMARRGEGMQSRDPREPGADYYTCIAGRIRVRLIDEYRPGLWVDIDPLPGTDEDLPSIYNRPKPPPLTKVRLPVVPLTEIQVSDSHARRVIERIAARRAGL
jgi:transcriptional regulator with XRE-family HTH domain